MPKDDPYSVSLDNGQIDCANGVKTLSHLLECPWVYVGPILLNPQSPWGTSHVKVKSLLSSSVVTF